MSLAGWAIAYLFRWFPHASPTGLFPIGTPDENAPVVVTANFSLTVKRVRRALRRRNVWLLVANSNGINVWCAATGGIFTENRVIDAVKVSGLSEKVSHREVVLPPLSAPGMDIKAIERETGFRAEFGPVYAKDIPAYLEAGMKKTEPMCRFRFDLEHRLDMFLSMNFVVYLAMAAVVAVFCRQYLAGATLLFWSVLAVLYLLIDIIPGKTGWGQAAFASAVFVLSWAGFDWVVLDDPLKHWGWFIAAFGISFTAGFDLAGIASARKSDPEQLMLRLGFSKLGTLFSKKPLGDITLDRDRCNGCGACREICPVGVYGELGGDGKTTFRDRNACFACSACVKQCPQSALRLGGARDRPCRG